MTCSPRVHRGRRARRRRARRRGGPGRAALAGAGRPRRPRAGGSRGVGGLGLSDLELVGLCEEAGWSALPEPFAETAGLVVPSLAAVADSPRLHRGAPPRRLVAAPHHRVWCGVLGRWRGTHARRVVTDHDGGHRRRARDQPRGWCRARRPVPARVPWRRRPRAPHRRCPGVPGRRHPFPRYHRDLGAVIWVPSASTRLASGEAATALLEGLCDRERCTRGPRSPALPTGSSP